MKNTTKTLVRMVIGVLIAFLLASTSWSAENSYVNEEVGYKITGPSGWNVVSPAFNNYSIAFTKYSETVYGNTAISLMVEKGYPYGNNPRESLENVLSQTERAFENVAPIQIIEEPHTIDRKGRQWEALKYSTSDDNLQYIYLAFAEGNTFILGLNVIKSQLIEGEQQFYLVMDSLEIQKRGLQGSDSDYIKLIEQEALLSNQGNEEVYLPEVASKNSTSKFPMNSRNLILIIAGISALAIMVFFLVSSDIKPFVIGIVIIALLAIVMFKLVTSSVIRSSHTILPGRGEQRGEYLGRKDGVSRWRKTTTETYDENYNIRR